MNRTSGTRPCRARPEPHRSPAEERGFTLVELLVVIALIALLASLLLPALAGARRSAQGAQCSSNLRQFAIAAQLYWDDHDGAAFRFRGAATNGGDIFWFGWLERGAEGERDFDPASGVLWPYLGSRGVAFCPAFGAPGPDFKPKALGGTGGYGYNLALSGPDDQPCIRLQSVARPSEFAVFADAAQVNDFQAPASPERPLLEEFYYVNQNEPTAHFRHRERCAVSCADGRVDRATPERDSLDPRLPMARVGRLPAGLLRLSP